MDLQLRGRRALITGGSKGIGLATAMVLAEEGCDLLLVGRSGAALAEAQQALHARYNGRVEIIAADVGAPGVAEQLAADAGHLDILINNAGSIPGGDLLAVDEPTWRAAWDLKVFGYINLTRAVYRAMAARRQGTILNVIGMAGERPDGPYIAGSTGNAALMAFTRALGGESVEQGIRVLAVNPGLVATDRLVSLLRPRAAEVLGDAERWQEFLDFLPIGRAATPEEIADVVAFMVSERAAYVSGTVVTVDGGFTGRGNIWGPRPPKRG